MGKNGKTWAILAVVAGGLLLLAYKNQDVMQGAGFPKGLPWTGWSNWPKAFWHPSVGN